MAGSWMTAGLASRGRRLLAAAVAILIGVGFLTSSMVALSTTQTAIEEAVAGELRDADLVATGEQFGPAAYDSLSTSQADQIATVPGVGSTTFQAILGAERGTDYVSGTSVTESGTTLLQGRMPTSTGEVVVNPILAQDVGVGESLTVNPFAPDGGTGSDATLQVVGVIEPSEMHTLSYGEGFMATDATLRELDPQLSYQSVQIDLAPGAEAETVRAAVAQALPDAVLRTGPDAAAEQVSALTGQTFVLGAILLGFGAVALLTAAIVIANTFTITLAQRTGELALLRCVGATRSQVRRSVLLEALALGLVASVVGAGAGIGLAQVLLMVGRRADLGIPLGTTGVEVGWLSVLVPVGVGLVVTVLASLWPAARATRVSPLAALRPSGEVAQGTRVSVSRIVLAVLLVAGGTGLMVFGASERQVLLGVAGGLVSFVGVLVAAVVIVPALVRLLGIGAGLAGVPGRLAVAGAVRNPGRAAATSAALLVGVTLITMTSVGAASGERTALDEIDRTYAVDLVAETSPGDGAATEEGTEVMVPSALEPGLGQRLAAVDGVAAAVSVETAYLEVGQWGPSSALALTPEEARQVLRSDELVDSLAPGTVGMGSFGLASHGVAAGDSVTVTGPGGSRDLRVIELGLGGSRMVLQPDDLTELSGGGENLQVASVLLRLSDDADVGATMSAVGDLTDDAGMSVYGAAPERAVIAQVLDVMVLVATALLGVAVLIAVVGIANTLSLSVIERQREHALVRGLGLTRGQLRGMLLTEGVLLSLVSVGVGLALGVGYAALGVQTILPMDTEVSLVVPWGTVAAIVGVAVLAGLMASVLPARRAAQVAPAQGLAAV